MSTLKMTFSLVSLILILGLVFASAPVMAHPVTADNSASGEIHDGDEIGLAHAHPEIRIKIMDEDPLRDGDQLVDIDMDSETAADPDNATMNFPIKLFISENAAQENKSDTRLQDMPMGKASGQLAYHFVANNANVPIAIKIYDNDGITLISATEIAAARIKEVKPGTKSSERDSYGFSFYEYEAEAFFRLDNDPNMQEDAKKDIVANGLNYEITVPEGFLVSASTLVKGEQVGQKNLASPTYVFEGVRDKSKEYTGTAKEDLVSHETLIEIDMKDDAGDPAAMMTLATSDFLVQQVGSSATSTLDVPLTAAMAAPAAGEYWYDAANSVLKIQSGTKEDSQITVTVDPDVVGKVLKDPVVVEVDGVAPVVKIAFSDPDAIVAGVLEEATVTVSEGNLQEDVDIDDFRIIQMVDGVQTSLTPSATYEPSSDVLTFTPMAASTVKVTVLQNAVMDQVGYTSIEVSETIAVTAPAPVVSATAAIESVTLEWTAVPGAQYEYSTDSGTTWTDAASPVTITGLTGNTPSTFEVRSKEDMTTTPVTPAGPRGTVMATPTAQPNAPDAPAVTVTPGVTNLTLDWTAVTGETYEYKEIGETQWTPATPPLTIPNLTGGTQYTYQVRVQEDTATSTPAGNAFTVNATPDTTPPAPAAPAVSATAAIESVTLAWTAVAGAQYEYSADSGTTWTDAASPMTITGLTGNTPSTFEVRVKADPATSTPAGASASVTATPMNPAPAAPVVSATADVNSVTLAWAAVTGVMYEYSADSGTTWTDAATSPVSPVTITGLAPGTQYTLEVRVKADSATSTPAGASGTVVIVTSSPPGAPDAPADVSATAAIESVTLAWTAVAGAQYEYSTDNGTNWTDAASPVTITGLTGGTQYTFHVRVKEDTATSTPAGASGTDMATPMNPAPAAPASVSATVGVNSVTLAWPAVTGVMYEYSTDSGTTWTDATSPMTIDGLTGGTQYTYQVRVKADPATATPAGASASVTATPTSPGAPDAPADVSADAGVNSVTLSWTAVSGAQYEYSADNGTTWTDAATSPVTIPGLTGNTPYTFQVRVKADPATATPAGDSGTDMATPMNPAPAAPAAVSATATINSVTLAWAAVTGVMYEYSADGGTTWTDAATSPVTITGLTPGTQYTYQVRVKANAATSTPAGDSGTTVILTAPTPGAPAAPVVSSTVGVNSVTLAWAAVAGALYEYSADGGTTWTDAASPMTIDGLIGGEPYTFHVRVKADTATSTPAGNSGTATATPTSPAAPAAPVVSATAGVNSVTLEWEAVSGETYEYSADGGTTWTDATSPVTIDGLIGGEPYTFEVRVKADTATSTPAGNSGTATATPTSPAVPPDNQFVIPASDPNVPNSGYVVIVRDSATTQGLTASILAAAKPWGSMPDLNGLFSAGGSLLLTTKAATLLDRDGDETAVPAVAVADQTAKEAAKPLDAIITEVMAAVNTAKIGQAGYAAYQWIELYNKLPVPITVTLSSGVGRPAPAAAADEVALDLLSNQVGAGWAFDLGQNGFDDGVDTTPDTAFRSFYRSDRGKAGSDKAAWKTSEAYYLAGDQGTPGQGEPAGAKTFTKSATGLKVVFNEVSNHSNANYEWIELLVREGTPTFENYQVSMVTAVDTEDEVFTLPKIDKYSFAAGDVLLVTDSDPAGDPDHPLAAGHDVTKTVADNGDQGRDASIKYIVRDFKKALPDDGNFLLVLRHGNDKIKTKEKVEDVAGRITTSLTVNTKDMFTDLWPLEAHGAANLDNNKLEAGVHRRQQAGILGTTTTGDGNHIDKTAFRDVGWTGIGYKRNAADTSANGGTPGYPNDALKADNNADAMAAITISEIMVVAGTRTLSTWIELQNLSDAVGVNLNGWRVSIINNQSDGAGALFEGALTDELTLDGVVPPGQHYLIVSRSGRNDTNLPSERIDSFGLKRTELLLNPYGFQIKLEAKKDSTYYPVDTVGNLDLTAADSAKPFRGTSWTLPEMLNEDGDRISIVRVSNADGPLTGTDPGAWRRYDMSAQMDQILDPTTYGHESDIGSPGHHPGGVLPVSLSKFRPERAKDTGEVVIRWATESELNNAGFNILRSDTRDGQFSKINTSLIAGQGTTSERTTYEWKDTSAKPNVVYYYQIQDVSLDGQVTTLQTTHLRGNVTAAGKLTTTWGELKALQ